MTEQQIQTDIYTSDHNNGDLSDHAVDSIHTQGLQTTTSNTSIVSDLDSESNIPGIYDQSDEYSEIAAGFQLRVNKLTELAEQEENDLLARTLLLQAVMLKKIADNKTLIDKALLTRQIGIHTRTAGILSWGIPIIIAPALVAAPEQIQPIIAGLIGAEVGTSAFSNIYKLFVALKHTKGEPFFETVTDQEQSATFEELQNTIPFASDITVFLHPMATGYFKPARRLIGTLGLLVPHLGSLIGNYCFMEPFEGKTVTYTHKGTEYTQKMSRRLLLGLQVYELMYTHVYQRSGKGWEKMKRLARNTTI